MLPVAGVPFVAHQLAQARAAGVDAVALATHYRAEVFRDWLEDGSRLGLHVEYVVENEPLGTGGAIRHAVDRLPGDADDPVLVFNGDVLSGHDIRAQVAAHQAKEADVTLYLTEVEDPRAFGCVPTDADGRVLAFLEKTPNPVTNRINAGCYVFRRSVIDGIPSGRPVSVERETFPGLLSTGANIVGHIDSAYWLDLGTPHDFVQGSRDLVLRRVVSPAVPEHPGDWLRLPGSQVDPSADVRGGTVVGARSVVEEGAVVDGSVVQDGAFVRAGAVVLDSVVGRGAVVGERTVLHGCVVGDGAIIGPDNELGRGVRVWTDATLAAKAVRYSSDET
jgi:mannose-1-phosphate guanylyltransferase